MAQILPDDRVRQGPSGRPVLVVLIAALLLCGVAIAGYLTWVTMTSPNSPSQDASRAAVTGSPTGRTQGSPGAASPPPNSGSTAPATPVTPRPATSQ